MNSLMKRNSNGGNAPATSFGGVVDKIFQNNLNRFFDDNFWGFNGLERNTSVPVNIRETAQSYELELVAPGLKKEDFKVGLNGDVLTISMEHQEEKNETNNSEGWLRKEYKTRSFSRSFSLDDAADANKISARYSDGILHISVPKKEGAQALSRTIKVS
jgi:HSP20 family protein